MSIFKNAQGEKIRTKEIVAIKSVSQAIAKCPGTAHLVAHQFGGETIFGQAAVYADFELLRAMFFAQMIGRARGNPIEVAGR